MRITQANISTLKKGDKFWEANATFRYSLLTLSKTVGFKRKIVQIKGSYNKNHFVVHSIEKDDHFTDDWVIATTAKREQGTDEYTYEDGDVNGLFTTLEEAIAFSKKDLGNIDKRGEK